VSPGCGGAKGVGGCYAEAFAKRLGLDIWGPNAPRRFFGDKHWAEPLRWNAAAEKAGERHRVFCASMADVFEDYRGPDEARVVEARARVFDLIARTPALDWLLLTKRPQNVMRMVPPLWGAAFPRNVWMGTTCEDQQRADERIPHLLACPAAVRWISYEPALGPVDFGGNLSGTRWCEGRPRSEGIDPRARQAPDGSWKVPVFGHGIDWVVVGGESGAGARPFNVEWARDTIRQCRKWGAAAFVKQMGARPVAACGHCVPGEIGCRMRWNGKADDLAISHGDDRMLRVRLRDRAGADPAEWPEDLRVREFPAVTP